MNEKKKKEIVPVFMLILERFDDLEEETGVDFTHAKRVILRLAKKYNLFEL